MNALNLIHEKYDDGTILIAIIIASTLPLLIAGLRSLASDVIIGASNGNFQPLLLTVGLFGPIIIAVAIIAKNQG